MVVYRVHVAVYRLHVVVYRVHVVVYRVHVVVYRVHVVYTSQTMVVVSTERLETRVELTVSSCVKALDLMNGPMVQWTNGPMVQWTNGPMNGPNEWTDGPNEVDHARCIGTTLGPG